MTVYIHFSQAITSETVNALTETIGQITNQDGNQLQDGSTVNVENFYILFNSSGGHVDPGIALYNFLDGLTYPITIHNVSSVDSVSTVIFFGRRYALRSSRVFILIPRRFGAISTRTASFAGKDARAFKLAATRSRQNKKAHLR